MKKSSYRKTYLHLFVSSLLIFSILSFFLYKNNGKLVSDVHAAATVRVRVIVLDPIIESENNQRLSDLLDANDPNDLIEEYISDVSTASDGYVDYEVVSYEVADYIATLVNNYTYSDEEMLACAQEESNCQLDPDEVPYYIKYSEFLNDFQACDGSNNDDYDELWVFGSAGMGFYESIMAGPRGYWTNGPSLTNSCNEHMHIMGFNYSRTNLEMLESLGHRIEGTLDYVFDEYPSYYPYPRNTPWGKFSTVDIRHPGLSACGTIHHPPNATVAGDYSNPNEVGNNCPSYYEYPQFVTSIFIDCDIWGCDQYGFLKWWMYNLPANSGMSSGYYNNWWKYIVEYDLCPKPTISLQASCNGSSVTMAYTWNAQPGATQYHFQLDDESTYSQPRIRNTYVSSPSKTVNNLTSGVKYYARIRSKEGSKAYCVLPGLWGQKIKTKWCN